MKNVLVVLVALTLFMGCEAPMDDQNHDTLVYRGRTVETGPAPFLVQQGLAKDDKGAVVISESSASETVYGLVSDGTVYLASGGEALAEGTWIGSADGEPIEVSVGSNIILTFASLAEVTLIQADNIIYADEEGVDIVFSGTGVILTTAISTGLDGSATLITTAEFGIGDGGCDPQ